MASPLDPFNTGQRTAAQQAEQMQAEAMRAQREQIAFQMELNQATRHKVQLERQILELTIEARKAESAAWQATTDLRRLEISNSESILVKLMRREGATEADVAASLARFGHWPPGVMLEDDGEDQQPRPMNPDGQGITPRALTTEELLALRHGDPTSGPHDK